MFIFNLCRERFNEVIIDVSINLYIYFMKYGQYQFYISILSLAFDFISTGSVCSRIPL